MALRGARTVLPLRERVASRLRGRRADKNTVFHKIKWQLRYPSSRPSSPILTRTIERTLLPWSAEAAPFAERMSHVARQSLERLAVPYAPRGWVIRIPRLKPQHGHPSVRRDRLGDQRLRRVERPDVMSRPEVSHAKAFMRGIDDRLVAPLITVHVTGIWPIVDEDNGPCPIWKTLAPGIDSAAASQLRIIEEVSSGQSHALIRAAGSEFLIDSDDLLVAPRL